MSMPTEDEFYAWFYSRVSGNGSVRFDSDAMDDEEHWVRYFARAARHFMQTRATDLEEQILALADDADQNHQDGNTRPDWMWVANTMRRLVENAPTY